MDEQLKLSAQADAAIDQLIKVDKLTIAEIKAVMLGIETPDISGKTFVLYSGPPDASNEAIENVLSSMTGGTNSGPITAIDNTLSKPLARADACIKPHKC